jgi:hypothetical protein
MSGSTVESSSMASSASTMRRGSAKSEAVLMSVASTCPFRSTMSGRAAVLRSKLGMPASASWRPR